MTPSRRDSQRQRELMLDAVRQDADKRRSVHLALEQALARVVNSLAYHHQGIAEESFESAQRSMDAFLFAAHQLSGIAGLMSEIGLDAAPALVAFEAKTAHLKTARNAFAHYEDYLLGMGREQTTSDDALSVFYSRSATQGTAIHLSNPSVVIDIGEAIRAAEGLSRNLTQLLEQSRASVLRGE